MQLPLNKFASQLQVSGIRAISNRIPEIDDVINLTVGQPDFPVPTSVKDAMKQAVDHNFTSYSHNAGLPELRKIVAQYYKIALMLHLKQMKSLSQMVQAKR